MIYFIIGLLIGLLIGMWLVIIIGVIADCANKKRVHKNAIETMIKEAIKNANVVTLEDLENMTKED